MGKKLPLIPPLIINDKLITDFKTKAYQFNIYFSSQCTTISNSSQLPSFPVFNTNGKLSMINVCEEDVLKIIQNLNPNKAHGHDNISIRMIKICTQSVVRPLSLIFRNCINDGVFPNVWKKANVIRYIRKTISN